MRRRYIVAYDVASAQRLRKTYRTMHGFGDPIQYSVFLCELGAVELQLLKERLSELLNFAEDRVMFVDLGEVGGSRSSQVEVIGKQLLPGKDSYEAIVI